MDSNPQVQTHSVAESAIVPSPVWRVRVFPIPPSGTTYRGLYKCSSVLTLPSQRQRQTPQIKGSVLQEHARTHTHSDASSKSRLPPVLQLPWAWLIHSHKVESQTSEKHFTYYILLILYIYITLHTHTHTHTHTHIYIYIYIYIYKLRNSQMEERHWERIQVFPALWACLFLKSPHVDQLRSSPNPFFWVIMEAS